MKLHKFDSVELAGIHPTNPLTGVIISEYLQSFVVLHDVEGTHIPPDELHPRFMVGDEPIPMERLVRVNFRRVDHG